MSPDWRPDDSLPDRNAKGEVKGARRVSDVLRKRGIRAGNRVTTSRDPGMAAVRQDLKRTGMPTGVEQWQLPVALPLENVLVFTSRMKSGAAVPEHAHRVWVFRVVMPPGQSYSSQAGPDGCVILYAHCVVTPPPRPPGPGPNRPTSG